MSGLPRLSGRECAKVFERAGFIFDRQVGSHMIYIRGNPFCRIVIPDHKELGTGILRALIRQAGSTVEEFKGFNDA